MITTTFFNSLPSTKYLIEGSLDIQPMQLPLQKFHPYKNIEIRYLEYSNIPHTCIIRKEFLPFIYINKRDGL